MADYAKFKEASNVSNNDIIAVLRKKYPSFSKIQCSLINNPEKYGMCLTKEAESILFEHFGHCDGFNVKPKKKSQVKRTKTKRLAVRLDDRHYYRVKSKMQQMGCTSVQEFLETLLENITEGEDQNEI